jgi:hypothetical protein
MENNPRLPQSQVEAQLLLLPGPPHFSFLSSFYGTQALNFFKYFLQKPNLYGPKGL